MHAPSLYYLLRRRLVENEPPWFLVSQAERRRDTAREQERLVEKERARPAASMSHYRGVTSPRTPKRGDVAPTASGSNHYLHVAGSPRGGYLYSPSPGAGLYQHLLTPQARQVGRPPNQSPARSSKNPPTPLDSLVDVALNMAEDSPPSRRRMRARCRRDGAHLARGCVVRWTCVRTRLRRMGKNQRSKLEGVNHEHDWERLLHRGLFLLRRG